MFLSDAMMIPSSNSGAAIQQSAQEGIMPATAAARRHETTGTSWVGPSWPLVSTSVGRHTPHVGMGTSPFGKSVDMVDVCKQLMEGMHRPWLLSMSMDFSRQCTCSRPAVEGTF